MSEPHNFLKSYNELNLTLVKWNSLEWRKAQKYIYMGSEFLFSRNT